MYAWAQDRHCKHLQTCILNIYIWICCQQSADEVLLGIYVLYTLVGRVSPKSNGIRTRMAFTNFISEKIFFFFLMKSELVVMCQVYFEMKLNMLFICYCRHSNSMEIYQQKSSQLWVRWMRSKWYGTVVYTASCSFSVYLWRSTIHQPFSSETYACRDYYFKTIEKFSITPLCNGKISTIKYTHHTTQNKASLPSKT